VAFRSQLLRADERHLRVLHRAAELANWQQALEPALDGAKRARGIAIHRSFGSVVAQVAEVSLTESRQIRVHRVDCVIDCGTPVNPNLIRQQMEGAIVFGLSATLPPAVSASPARHDFRVVHGGEHAASQTQGDDCDKNGAETQIQRGRRQHDPRADRSEDGP
jgi:isoquinoline 1-oxidoreductase subunit beta